MMAHHFTHAKRSNHRHDKYENMVIGTCRVPKPTGPYRTSNAASHTRPGLYTRSLLAYLHMRFSRSLLLSPQPLAQRLPGHQAHSTRHMREGCAPLSLAPTQRSSDSRESGSARASAGSKIGDLRALHRRDGPGPSSGPGSFHGKEGLRPIPEVTCSGRRRFWPCVARWDVEKAPARGLHRCEVVSGEATRRKALRSEQTHVKLYIRLEVLAYPRALKDDV